MYDKKVLGLAEAQVAIQAIIEEESKGPPGPFGIAVAVVDENGDVISVVRTDRARVLFTEMAIKKAYTAAIMMRDTKGVGELRRTSDWGSFEPMSTDMTIIPGGLAVTKPGEKLPVYGGIGMSGKPTGEEDEALAYAGLKALQKYLWPS